MIGPSSVTVRAYVLLRSRWAPSTSSGPDQPEESAALACVEFGRLIDSRLLVASFAARARSGGW